MKIILLIIITTLLSLGLCHAQKINDSGYRTVGYITVDGSIQDGRSHCVVAGQSLLPQGC